MATTRGVPPPRRRTSHGYARRSTYRGIQHLRRAPQPLTCLSLLGFLYPYTYICELSLRTNLHNDAVDISREAQLTSIESSFAAARSAEQLGVLRHPTKPRLRAIATYEVLPDADVWANAYDLFRFSERPGERGPEVRLPSQFFFTSTVVCVVNDRSLA